MKAERKTIWAVLVVGLGICISWLFRRGPDVAAPLAAPAPPASSRLRLQLHDGVSLNLPAARSSSPILFDDQKAPNRFDSAESFDTTLGELVRARTVVVRADEASDDQAASPPGPGDSKTDRKTGVGRPSESGDEKRASEETAGVQATNADADSDAATSVVSPPPQGRIRGFRTLGAAP